MKHKKTQKRENTYFEQAAEPLYEEIMQLEETHAVFYTLPPPKDRPKKQKYDIAHFVLQVGTRGICSFVLYKCAQAVSVRLCYKCAHAFLLTLLTLFFA